MFQIILTIVDSIFYLSMDHPDTVTVSCHFGGIRKTGVTYGDLEINYSMYIIIYLLGWYTPGDIFQAVVTSRALWWYHKS